MSGKEVFEKVVEVYLGIGVFLRLEVIHLPRVKEALIAKIMRVYESVKDHVSLDLSEEFLREAHEQRHSKNSNKGNEYFDYALPIVESAFTDLARQLRNPKARQAFDMLRGEVDPEKHDLFIHLRNAKLLAKDLNGPAVVTVVVDNLDQFKWFVKDPSSVESVHSSDET